MPRASVPVRSVPVHCLRIRIGREHRYAHAAQKNAGLGLDLSEGRYIEADELKCQVVNCSNVVPEGRTDAIRLFSAVPRNAGGI